MAYKVLYVTGCSSTHLAGIKSLNYTRPQAIMTATGDNANGVYPGRKGPASGTVTCEDGSTVGGVQALGRVESLVFTCKQESSTNNVTVTCTGFVAGNIVGQITDGTRDNPVVGYDVAFMAESAVEANA